MRPSTVLPWSTLALAAGLTIAACGGGGPARHGGGGPPPVAVEAVEVRPQSIHDVVELVGQLDADESVIIKPETDGIIAAVAFHDGDRVAAGEVLFQLRDEEERAKLREAQAQLALAEEAHRRAATLARRNTVAAAELDRAAAELNVARARVDLAQVELDRMRITAPFDGVLGARLVSPGDRVQEDTALVRIDAVDRLKLVFTVPEMAVRIARTGVPLEVSVVPFPDRAFPGKVYFVDSSLDPRSRRLLVKAMVANPDGLLRPGMFANVRIEIGERSDVLAVPESAVAYDPQGPFVWRLTDDDTVEPVRVALGLRSDGDVEITRGLAVGDRIVSAGIHKVAAGRPVEVVPAPRVAQGDEPGSTS